MHIVYDIDDVLADFWGTALPMMNQHFSTDVEKHHFVDYGDVGSHFGVTQQDFMRFVVDHDVLHHLTPTKWVNIINADFRAGHKITVISSRDFHSDAHDLTKRWLRLNKVLHHDLFISGQTKKSDFVDSVDMIIDDHTKNIDDFFDSGVMNTDGKGILVAQPWNQNYYREGVKRL